MSGLRMRRGMLFSFVALILPPSRVKNRLLSIFNGVEVDPTAIVGRVIIMKTSCLSLGANSRLGHMTMVRRLRHLRLESGARIGNFNIISSAEAFECMPDDGLRGRLTLGAEAAVTNRHYIDCSGGVKIDSFTTIAGCRSTILTHQIDLEQNRQVLAPVVIGERCFLSSNVSIAPGATVGERIVVGMGALVRGNLDLSGHLYGGVPARSLGLARNRGYASRSRGPVDVCGSHGTVELSAHPWRRGSA